MVKLLRRVLSEIRCDLFMRSGEFSSIRRESLLDVITGGELNAPRRISNRGGTSTRGASSMPVSNSKDARVTTNFLLLDPPGLRAPVSLAPTMDRNPARNPWKNVTVSGTRRESTLREPTFIYIHPLLPSCDVPRSLFRFESKASKVARWNFLLFLLIPYEIVLSPLFYYNVLFTRCRRKDPILFAYFFSVQLVPPFASAKSLSSAK